MDIIKTEGSHYRKLQMITFLANAVTVLTISVYNFLEAIFVLPGESEVSAARHAV